MTYRFSFTVFIFCLFLSLSACSSDSPPADASLQNSIQGTWVSEGGTIDGVEADILSSFEFQFDSASWKSDVFEALQMGKEEWLLEMQGSTILLGDEKKTKFEISEFQDSSMKLAFEAYQDAQGGRFELNLKRK